MGGLAVRRTAGPSGHTNSMTAAIDRQTWDVVLADYSMPQFNAKAALGVLAKTGVDAPCIVVSGAVGEETAVEVMRAGAQDLILKHNLKRLVPAIARELEAAQIRRERKAADARLDCERQLLQQLMKGIPDAVSFNDKERRYTRLNDAERSILNVENAVDVIGRTADGFVSSALAQKRRMEEERVLTTGEPVVDCVETLMGPDGKALWLSATKAPIRGAEGDIIGIVEIARDITESKRQEQLKNEFVATVSHELRTPLTSIMGSIGCLAGGAADTCLTRRYGCLKLRSATVAVWSISSTTSWILIRSNQGTCCSNANQSRCTRSSIK